MSRPRKWFVFFFTDSAASDDDNNNGSGMWRKWERGGETEREREREREREKGSDLIFDHMSVEN